jgi:hypothetical protein
MSPAEDALMALRVATAAGFPETIAAGNGDDPGLPWRILNLEGSDDYPSWDRARFVCGALTGPYAIYERQGDGTWERGLVILDAATEGEQLYDDQADADEP